MNEFNRHQEMLRLVAQALGKDLLDQVAFVGGCTTGLLITDPMTKEDVRYTDDVDLIVGVLGYSGWNAFSEQLAKHGFKISMQDEIYCRFRLGALQVDFMPDDENVLGFTNRWYKAALRTAQNYPITPELDIRLVTPVYFLATKLEAFNSRGKKDLLSSRDSEDILNVIDGREELLDEIQQAPDDVKTYLINEFSQILLARDLAYAVQSTAGGDSGREQLIHERIEAIAEFASNSQAINP